MPRLISFQEHKHPQASLSASRCLNALLLALAINASTQPTIRSPPGRSHLLPIKAAFLISRLPISGANQPAVVQTCATPANYVSHEVDDTEEDILRRLSLGSVTSSNGSNSDCLPLATPQCLPQSENLRKHREDGCLRTQDEVGALSDELFLSAPLPSSDPKLVTRRSQEEHKAHILTTLKKLGWLANSLFPSRLMAYSLGLSRNVVKVAIITAWRLVRGCAMVLGWGLEFTWEGIIFPLLFPVRLLVHIFVVFPYKTTSRIYQAFKPLYIFLASAVTVGVLIGLVAGIGNAVLGDWIISAHRARMRCQTVPVQNAAVIENRNGSIEPSGLEPAVVPLSTPNGLRRLNGTGPHDGSITTATQLNESVARYRSISSPPGPNADSFAVHNGSVHLHRDGLAQQPIISNRDRSYSGSSAGSRASSILKGSRKKAGASSFAGRSDASLSGTSIKGKKKKVTFKND